MQHEDREFDYKKGEIVAITGGEYSGYGLLKPGLGKVLVDFNMCELAQEFKVLKEKTTDAFGSIGHDDLREFTTWLVIVKKFVKPLSYKELHIGDYSSEEYIICDTK